MIELPFSLKVAGAAFALGASIGAAAWHFTPVIGPGARIERLQERYRSAETAATQSERRRAAELAQARKGLQGEVDACRAETALLAQTSARITRLIERMQDEPADSDCDVRLIDRERLCDATGIGCRTASD